jgi:hypothetical protein
LLALGPRIDFVTFRIMRIWFHNHSPAAIIFTIIIMIIGAEIAQSVLRRATAWKVWVRFTAVQDLSLLLHSAQTDSATHPDSYTVSTGGPFPGR